MTEAGRLLKEAYEGTAELVTGGYRTLPTHFRPIWEMVKQGYDAIHTVIGDTDDYDMYNVFYNAGAEYNKIVKHIGVDSAFSSVVCAFGIEFESPAWYRIMAHHYVRQAERIELD